MSTINVNLRPCTCQRSMLVSGVVLHASTCPGTPVEVPCPVPRSSWTLEVAWGKCGKYPACAGPNHAIACAVRKVRVACNIGGDGTWAGAEIVHTEVHPDDMRHVGTFDNLIAISEVCRDRLALLKALLTNTEQAVSDSGDRLFTLPAAQALFRQRDAVFSVLADMARAEEVARAASEAFWRALPVSAEWEPRHPARDAQCPSSALLARYVKHLMKQLETLGVAP